MSKKQSAQLIPADPLQRYLQEVHSYPVLTLEQEQKLAKRYHELGDVEAAKALVLAHLKLVVKVAMEYRNAYQNILDLIQEGNLGLMQAVKNYDPEKGARFGYYATWWIKSYILKYILDNFRLIKIGTTKAQRKLFYNLMQEKSKLEALGFYATPQVLSKKLGVKEKEIIEMQKRLTQPEYALQAPVNQKGEKHETILQDFIADEQTPLDEKIAQAEAQDILHKRLEEFAQNLNERDLKIFRDRLVAEIPITLQEIANEYGITKERVRQLEERITKNLKKFFQEKGVEVDLLK
ncbi:MAG: RNA polymerase factor sigma-32 [Pseudomonadota bacterium]